MIVPEYAEKKFTALEEHIGIHFHNKNHLVQSVVHRSYLNEHRDFPLAHNERMEFLGDAVLELSVTQYLFENYLNTEGDMTNWRASLVNAKMCAAVASELGLETYLFLSHGEAKDSGTKAREYILANALEALIGAIYIDQGWDITNQFITRFVISRLPDVLEEGLWVDPKSRFQEAAQELLGITPTYRVLKEEGPDHNKQFIVGVYLEKEKVAEGNGSSKQEAQVSAAEAALLIKKWKRSKVEILPRSSSDPIG